MNKNPTLCLLGASFGTCNMGVNALTAGTVKAFFKGYPGGDLFFFDYGKNEETYSFQIGQRTVRAKLVNIRFSKKFYLRNNIALLLALAVLARCIPFRRITNKIISRNSRLSRLAGADIVASMAGGDSFSDIYGMGRFLYVALPQLLALIVGKKLVLLPQTIGPFKGAVAKTIARTILRRAAVIYSRDHAGMGAAKGLLGPGKSDGKIRFCYDVGFVVDTSEPGEAGLDGLPNWGRGNFPLVGLNVSGLLFMGGYTQNNMFGLKTDYRRLVCEIIGHLIGEKGASVLLVPHVFGPKDHAESDAAACESLYAELKNRYPNRLHMARGSYDQGEIKHIIGLCNLFIGSRMHACIAALSQNIPAVAIAYSGKFAGVLETIGAGSCVADPRKLALHDVLAVIDRSFDQRAAMRQQLEQTMPGVRETVLRLFPDIVSEV